MCTACLAAGMSRRLVLGAGVAALTAAPLVATAQAQPARAVDTPDAALTRLVEGNAEISELVRQLEEAQSEDVGLGGELPSGDALAREFQAFLRQRGDDDERT